MKRVRILSNSCMLLFIAAAFSFIQSQEPVKVFILAGQSNMEGHGNVPLDRGEPSNGNQGTLEYMVDNDPGAWDFLRESNGDWVERDDVWIYYRRGQIGDYLELKGNLSPDYGASPWQIGPELLFGHRAGDFFEEQVLIIKTAWGGKSLGIDFRPPSSGGTVGVYYNEIVNVVESVLDNIGTHFPGYDNQGYEITGFGWHQGWNDGGDESLWTEYEENMVNFINDVRVSFDVENLPFVIASSGHGGHEETPYGGSWMKRLQEEITTAQIGATDPDKHPEFVGNAVTHNTWDYWRNDSISPGRSVHHWNWNGESYALIGNAMGIEMVNLLGGEGVSGCMDPRYEEFDSTATVPDSSACVTLPVAEQKVLTSGFVQGPLDIKINIAEPGFHRVEIFNSAGRHLYTRQGTVPSVYIWNRSRTHGLVFLRVTSLMGVKTDKIVLLP